ncbi:MAG: YggS family pyridoxal phosphate-dependent enzyme [Thermodesulfovibrionales bacterium]
MNSSLLIENISTIYKRISHAAMRAGRNPEDVKLIAVTKTVGIGTIKEAIDAGLRIFGENRVQEAQKKVTSNELRVTNGKIEWHLIGPLQRNKAKYAVRLFNLIHTIDSIRLAEEVSKQAEKMGRIQRVLVQVKLSEEGTKHGVAEKELMPLIKTIEGLKGLALEGLMTMPPFFEDPEKARPCFRRLRELRDEAEKMGVKLPELSMGMSNDFEVAIEEGATMVRIGTALFGERR